MLKVGPSLTPASATQLMPTVMAVHSPPLFRLYNRARVTRHVCKTASLTLEAPPLDTQVTPELGWKKDFKSVYQSRKCIGNGGFGQVRVGFHKESGQQVAIKSMPKVRAKLSVSDTLAKIQRETDMLQSLQRSPGVVQFIDCFEDQGSAQLVTELCQGGDLKDYVEECGPLDELALGLVAYEILKFIKACHDLGIVYGDVKPANFCLVEATPFRHGPAMPSAPPSGPQAAAAASFPAASPASASIAGASHLKAVDFGSSQLVLGSARLNKRHGTVVFMAPEVFAKNFAHKADIWSLGITLYWLYTECLPYWPDGFEPTQCTVDDMEAEIRRLVLRFDLAPWPEMSAEGKDFISRCLEKDESLRWSAEEALQHPWIVKVAAGEECSQELCNLPINKTSCSVRTIFRHDGRFSGTD